MLNLLHHTGLDFWRTCSVLGYCLIPVIALAALSIFMRLTGFFGLLLAVIAIAWATFSAVRLFDAKLQLTEQYWLVAYPVVLMYSCFVLITIF
jgi:protein YIPF5/7